MKHNGRNYTSPVQAERLAALIPCRSADYYIDVDNASFEPYPFSGEYNWTVVEHLPYLRPCWSEERLRAIYEVGTGVHWFATNGVEDVIEDIICRIERFSRSDATVIRFDNSKLNKFLRIC